MACRKPFVNVENGVKKGGPVAVIKQVASSTAPAQEVSSHSEPSDIRSSV